jgi:hypothetical protein
MLAMKKVAELMAEYNISLSDLNKEQLEKGTIDTFYFRAELSRYVFSIVTGIEELCMVKILVGGIGAGDLMIIGLPVDVEIANYLFKICVRAFETCYERETKANMLKRPSVRRRHVDSMLQGMCARLSTRVKDLAWAKRERTSNALIVVKDDIINDTMKDANLEVGNRVRTRHRQALLEDFWAGFDEASRINLQNAIRTDADDTTSTTSIEKNGPKLIAKSRE